MKFNDFKDLNGKIYSYSDSDLIYFGKKILDENENKSYTEEQYYQAGWDKVVGDGKNPCLYTEEELAEKEFENKKKELIAEAKYILSQVEHLENNANNKMYSATKTKNILKYIESLREVVRQAENGVLTELPILNKIE